MFQKTNFAFYEDYEVCKITVVPFQNQDTIFTSLYLKVELLDGDEVKFEVVKTKINYLDYSSSDAVCKDLRYIFRIFKKIHLPNKKIEVHVANLPAFLFITKQIPASSVSLKNWIGLFYKDLRNIKCPVEIKLGDLRDKLTYELFILDENANKKFTFPSTKYLGIDDLEYIRAQIRLRENYGNSL